MLINDGTQRFTVSNRRRWLRVVVFSLIVVVLEPVYTQSQSLVTIGVLALRGTERVPEHWQPTADYLDMRVPEYRFRVVPLGFDEIHRAIRRREVDFVLANSAYFVDLESSYGVSAVVTLRNRIGDGPVTNVFGGVIFTRSDREDIGELRDLRGRSFAAVDPLSFGGWHAGWRELLVQGIDPERHFGSIIFPGTHDEVVYAVLRRDADAGTVRTGTLEQMVQERRIVPEDIFVLNGQRVPGFPYRLSTSLYPEWPLARLPHVPEDLAVAVGVALMQMPWDHDAARAAHAAGWTLPLNYQPVHEALRDLRLGPYQYLRELTLGEFVRHNRVSAVTVVIAFWIVLGAGVFVIRINRKLRTLNENLEERVAGRTARVEALLQREQHLREIVETVADVNQIVITSESAKAMLKAACDRMVGHRDYRFAWIASLKEDQLVLEAHAYGPVEFVRNRIDLDRSSLADRVVRENRTLVSLVPDVQEKMPQEERRHDLSALVAIPLRPNAFSDATGVFCVYTRRESGFSREELDMLEQLSGDLGFAIHAFHQREHSRALQRDRINNYEETIVSLVDMIEKRDTYTAGHSRRVAQYCETIARSLGMDEQEINRLNRAAILHDVGKIVIPDSVLLNPGRLARLEFELIKQHVQVGYDMLAAIDMYRDLAEIMKYHHEREDGTGYPLGVTGGHIPLSGKIMAVADSFDAMTSNRIYRNRKSVEEALAELRSLAGRWYDVEVVDAAIATLRDVEPPSTMAPIPRTPIEKQRFAYFFYDQLTGVHNADYLEFLLRTKQTGSYRWACIFFLRQFDRYNQEYGWAAGDDLLRAVAQSLDEICPDSIVFRVLGDDFVVLSLQEVAPGPVHSKMITPLKDTPVTVDVTTMEVSALDSDALLERIRRHHS